MNYVIHSDFARVVAVRKAVSVQASNFGRRGLMHSTFWRKRMLRLTFVLLLVSHVCLAAQKPLGNDPTAVSLAQKSLSALTGGSTISDATLNGSATSVLGSDNETGSVTLEAKGTSESRVDLNPSGGEVLSDVRNITDGTSGGAWKRGKEAVVAYAAHNCWTDAAWFFPALSSLAQTANPAYVFQYLGQEQHEGLNTEHIRVFQTQSVELLQTLSTMDFYLDPTTMLPLSISFQVHPDLDANTNIPAEVLFANYQTVKGIQVPFSIQRMLNNGVVLDVTITSAEFNTGLSDSVFNLQ